MSSLPSEEGIHSLRLTLDRLAVIKAESDVLVAEISERRNKFDKLNAEHQDLTNRVPKMLKAMDIASNGNYGWEGRLVWALRELASQYREKNRS